jgi:hypothetical protein
MEGLSIVPLHLIDPLVVTMQRRVSGFEFLGFMNQQTRLFMIPKGARQDGRVYQLSLR